MPRPLPLRSDCPVKDVVIMNGRRKDCNKKIRKNFAPSYYELARIIDRIETEGALRVYVKLLSFAKSGNGAYPHNNWLAEECQMSERTVGRALSHLEEIELVERERLGRTGRALRLSRPSWLEASTGGKSFIKVWRKLPPPLRNSSYKAKCKKLYIDLSKLERKEFRKASEEFVSCYDKAPRKQKKFFPTCYRWFKSEWRKPVRTWRERANIDEDEG